MTPAQKRTRELQYYYTHREERLAYAKKHQDRANERRRLEREGLPGWLRTHDPWNNLDRRVRSCWSNSRRAGYAPPAFTADDILAEFRDLTECAICQTPLTWKEDCNLDHDHATGAFRGFLCRGCNTGLGGFKDAPGALQRAIVYLTQTAK